MNQVDSGSQLETYLVPGTLVLARAVFERAKFFSFVKNNSYCGRDERDHTDRSSACIG